MGITIKDLNVEDLHPNPDNPRKRMDDVADLAASIRTQGVKQPLLVTPTGQPDIDGRTQYRVVIGHRRLAAAKQAGLDTVPAIVEEMDPRREREIMLVENTQRSDLTPVEEADGYQGLLDLGMQVKEMARMTGRSDRFVRRRLKIAGIPRQTRDSARDFDQLTLDQLDKLTEFESDPDAQRELARARDFEWTYQKLSRQRLKTEWKNDAAQALTSAGVDVHDIPDGEHYWNWSPHGYVFGRVINDLRKPFWTEFTEDERWPQELVYADDDAFCTYRPIPADELEKAEAGEEAWRAANARRRELDRRAREFEMVAKSSRVAWLRDNLRVLSGERAREATYQLMVAETVGSGSKFPRLDCGENVVATLVSFGWSMPVAERDDGHWTLECGENLDAIRDTLMDDRSRILDVLAARRESDADWMMWRNRYGVDRMTVWYDVLERAGYQVSADERKALEGEYIDEKDES